MSCRNHRSVLVAGLLAGFTPGLSGCQGTNFFAPPGPISQQQANAIIHDPFPQADIGPVDMANRPPGYEQPLPEAVRNRIVPDAMPWLGQQ